MRSVSQVIDGAVDEVIHLIGYPNNHIQHLTTDGVMRSTNEVNSQLKQLPPRAPGSYLLQENDKLYGVIIDWNSEAKVVGLINEVIPRQQTNDKCNTVVIHRDGNWKTTNSRDHELPALISGGALFGMVANNGFLFLQTKDSTLEQLSQLVLIQQKGYLIIEDAKVDWIRSKVGLKIGQIESRVTTLEPRECLVSIRGGCVRNGDRFELFGRGNAIVSFDALHNTLISMRNAGLSQRQYEREVYLEVNEEKVEQNIAQKDDSSAEVSAPTYEEVFGSYRVPNCSDNIEYSAEVLITETCPEDVPIDSEESDSEEDLEVWDSGEDLELESEERDSEENPE